MAINWDEIEEQFRMKLKGDKYDVYRKEHNEIIEGKLDEINNLRQEKYITASCEKRDEDSAKSYFLKCEKELSAAFRKLGSVFLRESLHTSLPSRK